MTNSHEQFQIMKRKLAIVCVLNAVAAVVMVFAAWITWKGAIPIPSDLAYLRYFLVFYFGIFGLYGLTGIPLLSWKAIQRLDSASELARKITHPQTFLLKQIFPPVFGFASVLLTEADAQQSPVKGSEHLVVTVNSEPINPANELRVLGTTVNKSVSPTTNNWIPVQATLDKARQSPLLLQADTGLKVVLMVYPKAYSQLFIMLLSKSK